VAREQAVRQILRHYPLGLLDSLLFSRRPKIHLWQDHVQRRRRIADQILYFFPVFWFRRKLIAGDNRPLFQIYRIIGQQNLIYPHANFRIISHRSTSVFAVTGLFFGAKTFMRRHLYSTVVVKVLPGKRSSIPPVHFSKIAGAAISEK
jgi:hypothetical protein